MKEYNFSHYIQLGIHLDKDLGLRSVIIDNNTTDLPNDSKLLKQLAFTILKSLQLNKEDVLIQDLLGELDIVSEGKTGV